MALIKTEKLKLVVRLSMNELDIPSHILQMSKDEFELNCQDVEFEDRYNSEIRIVDKHGLIQGFAK